MSKLEDFTDNDLETVLENVVSINTNPLQFLRKNGKEGLKIIKGVFTTTFLFGLVNFILLIYAITKVFIEAPEGIKLTTVAIVLVVAIICTVFAFTKSYRYAAVEAGRIAYNNMTHLLQKGCNLAIDKTSKVFVDKNDFNSEQVKKIINVQEIFMKIFGKLPKFVSKIVTLILKRIPISEMVADLKNDIVAGNHIEASSKLFTNIDTKIREAAFEGNSKSWVYWLLPLNIIIILALIFFKVG